MDKKSRIYVAGHSGLIGSALVRRLTNDGYRNIITCDHSTLDLADPDSVRRFFDKTKPEYVFLAAARVGSIFANSTYRAEFIYENLMIQTNVIHQSFLHEVKKMVFFASADVYPKGCPQPAKEEYLLTGSLEPTCEQFALAKITGIKMCEAYNKQYGTNFIVTVPATVYGPNQRYDMMNSQVLPSLMKRFYEAKVSSVDKVVIWGSGTPVRDFIFVDDVVDACMFLVNNSTGPDCYNIGTGRGSTIRDLAMIIKTQSGYNGEVVFDTAKPDGVLKKLLDTTKITNLGWNKLTSLEDGIRITHGSFLTELKKRNVRITRITRVKPGKKDAGCLKKIEQKKKEIVVNKQPESYRNRIVLKPWGYEYLMFENELVAIWLLHLRNGNATSMHCHKHKKTSLILLAGNAINSTLTNRRYLKSGDTLILEQSVFHTTKAVSENGIFLLEVETPPVKTDLLRAEDRYGREKTGYEGLTEMDNRNLGDYHYFYFDEQAGQKRYTYTMNKFLVTFEIYTNTKDLHDNFRPKGGEIYTSCRGKIIDNKNNVLLDIGDVQKADMFFNYKDLHIDSKLVILKAETVG
jgi:GDP-L-fucose synthase